MLFPVVQDVGKVVVGGADLLALGADLLELEAVLLDLGPVLLENVEAQI